MKKLPIVTYAGNVESFRGLETNLSSALPQESVEWRRSYGRLPKSVHIEVAFVPFSMEVLTRDVSHSILNQPIFHTFWTDCSDTELYKTSVRDDMQSWVSTLRTQGITDWMVILVETAETRKANKLLPRATVLDKIKSDFGSKQAERCVSLIDPQFKSDSRSIESWRTVLTKMRHLLMVAFNRALNRFEENMRAVREKRVDKSWSFCCYFLMQEELAEVFSLLAIYDEALVQYDELDALFTQFILNSAAGDIPAWLQSFNGACSQWEGLHLTAHTNLKLQDKISSNDVSLFEFRNYLFQRQCALLFVLNKPWEVATRGVSFLRNTCAELHILDVNMMEIGGVACWGFLSCLEILTAIRKFKDPAATDAYALHSAALWAYARDKELGDLCGLMPTAHATEIESQLTCSAGLQKVSNLVCGMGEDPHDGEDRECVSTACNAYEDEITKNDDEIKEEGKELLSSPMKRLKEALSSPKCFEKHFLDLSELAISTYKHIGRIRSARLIGRELATFYMKFGEPQKAASFLTDQLKTFLEEGWEILVVETQMDLAKCYLSSQEHDRYISTCAHLSASTTLDEDIKLKYFHEMIRIIKNNLIGSPVLMPSERVFQIRSLKLPSNFPITVGANVAVEVELFSLLPESVLAHVSIMLKHSIDKPGPSIGTKKRNSEIERKPSTSSSASTTLQRKFTQMGGIRSPAINEDPELLDSIEDEDLESTGSNSNVQNPHMSIHLEYKQDKSLSTVSVTCDNSHKVLRRHDSHGGLYSACERTVTKENFPYQFESERVSVSPGSNLVVVNTVLQKHGVYTASQVSINLDQMEFLCNVVGTVSPCLRLAVVCEKPQVFLARAELDLLAGVMQPMILTIKSGSCVIDQDTQIRLKCSRGMTIRESQNAESKMDQELIVLSPSVVPFTSIAILLTVFADLGPQRDASAIEHSVSIQTSLGGEPQSKEVVEIQFIPPFLSTYKLQTAHTRKFAQITMSGLVNQSIELCEPKLELFKEKHSIVSVKSLNLANQILVVCIDQTSNYMWEVEVDYSNQDSSVTRAEFSVDYRPVGKENRVEWRSYRCVVDLVDYKTLYTVRARVEPSKGSDFCRSGNMCHMHISMQQVGTTGTSDADGSDAPSTCDGTKGQSIMYEVLADQTLWAVCGRTAGVLTLEENTKQNVTLDVMPLMTGFLPLPSVRLSRYIPADSKQISKEANKKADYVGTASSVPRLEPFSAGQVYNFSKALQVHVLAGANATNAPLGCGCRCCCIVLLVIVVIIAASLGAFTALFPYPSHASCKVDWTFGKPCSTVRESIVDQMKLSSGDYKYLGTDGLTILGEHTTHVFQFVDKLNFTLTAGSGGNCFVTGVSESSLWYAVLDFGQNYCNIHNLVAGAKLTQGDPLFAERSSNAMCTMYSFAHCSV